MKNLLKELKKYPIILFFLCLFFCLFFRLFFFRLLRLFHLVHNAHLNAYFLHYSTLFLQSLSKFVEGVKKLIEVNDFAEIMNPDLPNDDLDLQLLWLYVLEKKGTLINSCDLADAWIERCWYPFSEYGYFMKNFERGI